MGWLLSGDGALTVMMDDYAVYAALICLVAPDRIFCDCMAPEAIYIASTFPGQNILDHAEDNVVGETPGHSPADADGEISRPQL